MGIFNAKVVTESTVVEVEAYEGFVQPTLESLSSLLTESAEEAFQLNAGLYIQDIVIDSAVIEGVSEAEPLLENFVTSTWEKLKKIFNTLRSKVKAWFDAARKRLDILIKTGADFVNKYGAEISKKPTTGFKYSGFHWTASKGDSELESRLGKIEGYIKSTLGGISLTGPETADDIRSHGGQDDAYKNKDEKSKLVNDVFGGDNLSEGLSGLTKAYRNGESTKSEIEGFGANSVSEMLEAVKTGKEVSKVLKAGAAENDREFARVLDSIKRAQSEISRSTKDEKAKARLTAQAAHHYQTVQFALNISTRLSGVAIDAHKSMIRDFEKTLKSFLTWKGEKKDKEENKTATKESMTSVDSMIQSATMWL